MLVERASHPQFLSNTYLVADGEGGPAFFIDAGGPVAPLIEAAERLGLTPTHVLLTHHHFDHVSDVGELRERWPELEVLISERERELLGGAGAEVGGLPRRDASAGRGRRDAALRRARGAPAAHARAHRAGCCRSSSASGPSAGRRGRDAPGVPAAPRPAGLAGAGLVVFTGDTLFKDSVGGVKAPGHTTYTDLRDSIMGTLMELPPDTVIYPGHSEETSVAREWDENAFIRVWRGLDAEGSQACTALGEPATLVLLGADYDGGTKAWVRWGTALTTSFPARAWSGRRSSRRAGTRAPPPTPSMGAMARENEKIPTSRARRTATVATLAASEAVKQFGTRAANVTRGEEASEEAMARRQLETAKQIVAVLGTMKGAAMKLGQVMSFLDVGLVAEEHRDEFQRELAKLRDAAPTVSFKQMRRVIEEDLEEPISEVFASFEEEPIAAASIGQVYRATLQDGREVAVKVQYPGVAGAVRADMQNLDMILRLLKRMTPGLDVKAIAEEIKERIVEELDYELEAQNQRSLARIFAGHPFIVVPDVVSSLSRERVLVSEFVDGRRIRGAQGPPAGRARPHRRDRLPLLPRLPVPPPPVLRRSAPRQLPAARRRPHGVPGLRPVQAHGSRAGRARAGRQRAVAEGDAATLHELLAASGFLPEPERVDPEHLLAFIRDAIWWYTTADEEVAADARDRHAGDDRELGPALEPLPRDAPPDMRPEHLFGRRMEMLTLAVLSQLRARANWHRIAREWMYGDEPVTELGREEADFYGRSGVGARG